MVHAIARALSIVVLGIGVFLLLLRADNSRSNVMGACPVGELVAGKAVSQTFSAKRNGLDGVSFPIATCCRTNAVHLHMVLRRSVDGVVLAARNLDCSRWKDNGIYRISFPVERESEGGSYELRIESPDGKPGDAVTLWTVPTDKGGMDCFSSGVAVESRMLLLNSQYCRAWFSLMVSGGCVLFFALLWLFEVLKYRKESRKNDKRKEKDGFDWGMHYFRGFAIVCIVVMHIVSVLGHDDITTAFFRNSTVYFLFISGYLCQYLASRNRGSARVYYKKKLQSVIFPYFFVALVTWSAIRLAGRDMMGCIGADQVVNGGIADFIRQLFCGQMQSPHWYIPFVSALFLVSPLLIRMSNRMLSSVTVTFALLAVIFPARGGFDPLWPGIPLMYMHFTIYYLLGLLYCRYRDVVDCFLAQNFWLMIVGFLIIAVWTLSPSLIGLERNGTAFILSFQKLLMTGVVIVMLHRVSNAKILILDVLAKYSFTMFFIHAFFLQYFVDLKQIIGESVHSSALVALSDFLLVVIYVLFVLTVSVIVKRAFGRFSRYFVGS